uniref:Uncharacterized protein n=1 Tax=Acrobeloides nanus TaxID=290746 RepID=A0A914C452_9BILA
MFAVFEFHYTVANGFINISANFIEGNVTGGILNQTEIFSTDSTDLVYGVVNVVNAICNVGSVCSISLTSTITHHVYILYTIHYASETNYTTSQLPIISLNFTAGQPSYPLSTGCNSINSTRGNDGQHVNINVTDCYCCNEPDTWQNCPNVPEISIGTSTTFTKTSNSVRTTTGLGISNATITTTFMPTSIPDSLIINCTNPTNPFIINYCNLNHSHSSPGDIANNVTLSINPNNLTGYDVFVISQIMYIITNRTGLKQNVNVILAASEEVFESSNNGELGSTNRILTSVHNLMYNSPSNINFLNGTHVGLAGFELNCSIAESDTLMGDTGSNFLILNPNSDVEAMISIPTNVACYGKDSSRLTYSIYRNTKLFVGNSTHKVNALWKIPILRSSLQKVWCGDKAPNAIELQNSDDSISSNTQSSSTDRCTNGFWYGDNKVMTGSLLNNASTTDSYAKIQQFTEVNGERQRIVTVKYSKKKITKPLHGTIKLTWWTGFDWSHQTCSFEEDGDYWVSGCDHLTDFTLVVDGVQKDPSLCSTALTTIGYIMNIGSIISLTILNLIFLLHRISFFQHAKLAQFLYGRQNVDTFTLMYNIVLLIFYISFEQIMTWLTHKFVIIGGTLGLPTLLALIFGLAINNFFNRGDNFCWIRPDYIVPGVVLPLTLLVLNGIFCLTIVFLRLFPSICGVKLIKTNTNTLGKKKEYKEKLIALFFMQCTLGIPWILQYLTLFTPSVTAWHYLFTIVNGSQGIILLFIYFYKRVQQYKVTRQEISDITEQDTAITSDTKHKRSSTKETNLFNRLAVRISNGLNGKSKQESEGSNDEATYM